MHEVVGLAGRILLESCGFISSVHLMKSPREAFWKTCLASTPVTFVCYSRVATALGFVQHHNAKPVLDGHFCDIGVLLHLIGICKLNASLSCSNDSGHSSLETILCLAKMCFAKCQVASMPFQPSADEFRKLVKCQRWDIKLQRCSHTCD